MQILLQMCSYAVSYLYTVLAHISRSTAILQFRVTQLRRYLSSIIYLRHSVTQIYCFLLFRIIASIFVPISYRDRYIFWIFAQKKTPALPHFVLCNMTSLKRITARLYGVEFSFTRTRWFFLFSAIYFDLLRCYRV